MKEGTGEEVEEEEERGEDRSKKKTSTVSVLKEVVIATTRDWASSPYLLALDDDVHGGRFIGMALHTAARPRREITS